MNSKKNNRRSLFYSVISLLLCISMLLGTTLAWFSDSVSSTGNIIKTGRLKVAMHYADSLTGEWKDASSATIFNGNYWEPGYSDMKFIKVSNTGNLAFSYQMHILPAVQAAAGSVNLADVIDVYVGVVDANFTAPTAFSTQMAGMSKLGTLTEVMTDEPMTGVLLPASGATGTLPDGVTADTGDVTYCVVLHMQETAGNEYQNLDVGNNFTIQLVATQYGYEQDTFGGSYDANSTYPDLKFPEMMDMDMGSADVTVDGENKLTQDVTLKGKVISATVKAGTLLEAGTTKLVLTVEEKDDTDSNITLGENEELRALDVHVSGIADGNTVPVVISLGKVAPEYLNQGNLTLAHVENGQTVLMTQVMDLAELDAHNEFYYDVIEGELTVAMATFSEIAVRANTENAWKGEFDYSWYDASKTELTIANADQLAAFGAIVGGMDGQTRDSFAGKTVKLLADINLGDAEDTIKGGSQNNVEKIFYPIGYYYNGNSSAPSSTVYSFEGTFDGNGHTISSFYQNTWEIKGDYSGNYYDDAMGLFGYVVNGTVKNLTVDNFSSDGEFTPTGVIAAYAVNSTFENIAITNCNPRVYNTGNGGIVGIGGDANKDTCVCPEGEYNEHDDCSNLTFTNITIDNTNKITALWGSWDVACGGLVGMFRGAGHVNMTNCHVAAQIDVYNDVCGNYQYYWYRYSGMMVGTNKNMTTDANGYTVPETNKYHATGCTVHFGDWNDYYYCELVANSLASYTHDHQFSRLTEIASLDEIKSGDTWTKTGNFLLFGEGGKQKASGEGTCYHIMKDANGNLYEHKHDVKDATNPEINETVNGETVLKENNQRIYLPFNQLFTGYGWGVKHIPVYNGEEYAFEGITILDRAANSIEKFKVKSELPAVAAGETYTVGQFFKVKDGDLLHDIKSGNVSVFVSPTEKNEMVAVVHTRNATDWTQGTLEFSGHGKAVIVITDYYYCTETTLEVTVKGNGFLYRVGNAGQGSSTTYDVTYKQIAKLLTGKDEYSSLELTGVTDNHSLSYKDVSGNSVDFKGTGVVGVKIDGSQYFMEVVNAVNATSAMSATANNVVMLNDAGFGSLTVSGGHALYGNGFTLTCSSDSAAKNMEYAFVELENGTLDNVQIVCPNFSHAVLYESNKTGADSDGRYKNVRSAVRVTGNSEILNSCISGGRAAVYAVSGTLLMDNTTVEGGAAANIHVNAACSVTLQDVTLIQEPKKATVNDTSKTLMGLSVVVVCDGDGLSAPITLKGNLTQYAWANEDHTQYVPSEQQGMVSSILKNNPDYVQNVNGKPSLNLGFVYLPISNSSAPKDPVANQMIIDQRNAGSVSYGAVWVNGAYVYSSKRTNDEIVRPEYDPTNQASSMPIVTFTDANAARLFESKYDATVGSWVSELKVDVDQGNYSFNFSNLLVQKYGQNLTYSVKTADGTVVDKNTAITLNTSVTYEYILTITDDQIYNQNGGKVEGASVTRTHIFRLLATKTSLPAPTWTSKTLNGTPYIVVDSKGGDWNCAVPVLDGMKVKYWSKKQNKEIELDLANVVTAAGLGKGLQNGANNSITITVADEYTLTIISSGFKTNDNGKPVVVDGKLYFTVASSSNYVSTKTADRAPSFTYTFTDANNSDPISTSASMTVTYATYTSKQYKYAEFCNGNLEEATSCFTPDTLIALADGTQKRIDALTGEEKILAWDFFTGSYVEKEISLLVNHGEDTYRVANLEFSDGTVLRLIADHGVFDYDLNKFVYITVDNMQDYVGHRFVQYNADGSYNIVTLEKAFETEEVTSAYSVSSSVTSNAFASGMLTVAPPEDFYNWIEMDGKLHYDVEQFQKDVETYGLYTYEDFADYVTYEQFVDWNGAYLKIPVEKGLFTFEYILELIEMYKGWMP